MIGIIPFGFLDTRRGSIVLLLAAPFILLAFLAALLIGAIAFAVSHNK